MFIYGENEAYIDRGILVDHYHYLYGEEQTLFVFSDEPTFDTYPYYENAYFYGEIRYLCDEYIIINSTITNSYTKEGESVKIMLTNIPKITLNNKEIELYKLYVGQLISANATSINTEKNLIVITTNEIMASEGNVNSMAAGLL